MSWLSDALAATHPDHGIDVPKVEAWLKERDVFVREDFTLKWKREDAARKVREKVEADARFAAAPIYTGTAVDACQAVIIFSRRAPMRCYKKGKLRLIRSKHEHRLIAVCRSHARKNNTSPYTGWAGDPNPDIGQVEAEYEALVP